MTAAWNRWWFAPADPRVYALLRIGYGLLGLWLYVPMWDEVPALLGDGGVYPLAQRDADYGPERVSVYATPWWSIGGDAAVQAVYAGMLLAFAGCVFGVASRVSLAVAWLGVVSMLNRNAVWTDGSDVLLRVFGFYLLLAPVGRAWSVDARLRPASGPVPGWPLRLFQLQVCILYVRTGVVKALDGRWQDGVAVWHALHTSYFWRFPMEGFLASDLFQAWTVFATYATLVFEIGFPLVLVAALRRWVLGAGLALHLGIAAFMALGGFSEAILWTYLAFVVLPERR